MRMPEDSRHERFRIPHDPDLFADTWAEQTACPNCGRPLESGVGQCPACKQWIGECGLSCPGCPSPICIGKKRPTAEKGQR